MVGRGRQWRGLTARPAPEPRSEGSIFVDLDRLEVHVHTLIDIYGFW